MFLRLISAAFFASYASCNMTISTSQNYYIRYQTLEINCTSTVTVDRNVMFITILNTSKEDDKQQVASIAYRNKTCQRLVNGMNTKCGDECRCTLNGRSITYYYNVTKDTPTLELMCHTLNVNLTNRMNITKAVEPSKNIAIYSEPESYVNESMNIMLQCRVNGGHPLANITWSCNGRQITTTHVTNETFVVGKTNMTVYKEDNNRECTCTADHFLWKEPPSITETKRLNVYFAPQSDVLLTGLQPNITTLYEYDSLNATCSINGGNPLPNLTFKCGTLEGNETIINAFVTAVIEANVNRSFDKIQCICIAKHILLLEEISRRVVLQVYYTPSKPTLSFVPSTPLLEGQFLKMKCKTTDKGNPPIHMYQWHSHSDNTSTKEEVYNYRQVTKDDNNIQFYCSVINKYTEYRNISLESNRTNLNVEYKPWINVTETNLTIVEGQPTLAICTANGNPEPKVHWKFEGINIGEETEPKSELRFNLTNRNQHGVYTCFAKAMSTYHGELNSSFNIYLTVNYPPDVNVVTVDQNLTEGGSVTLICNVSGRPDQYTFSGWLHSYHGIIIRRMQPVNENTLLLTDLTYEDIGTYTCIASNGVENSNKTRNQTGHQYLHIKGTPMKIPQCPDIPRFTAEQFSRLSANIRFFSYPNITEYQWYNLSSNSSIEPSNDVHLNIDQIEIPFAFHNTSINLTNFAYEAKLTIDEFQTFDGGFYSFVISNGKHINNFTVRISVSGPPEAPRTTSYQASTRAINLYLIPGFNGGHKQTIYINYSICDHQAVPETKAIVDIDTEMQIVQIGNLQPSTTYCLTIFSSNMIGSSMLNETHCCEQLTIRTTEQALSQPSGSAIGIIGGVTGSIAGITAILVVVIIFLCRRHSQKDGDIYEDATSIGNPDEARTKLNRIEDNHRATDSDEGDGLNDNPLYVSSGDDIVSKNTKYSQVLKEKEQDQSTKLIEMGCIYENHDDFIKENEQMYTNQKKRDNEYKPTKNKDGLIYADLDLATLSGERKFVIHGMENRNNYAIIDLTKKADSLPSDDDDDGERGSIGENDI